MINMLAVIMSPGFDFAAKYYQVFSTDVSYCGDQILVEGRRIVRVAMHSLTDLLSALKRQATNGDKQILVACHGSPEGLLIPVSPGHGSTLTGDILDDLLSALDNATGARDRIVRSKDKQGRSLFGRETQVDDLLALIRDVRAAKFDRVEFRCCNLGAGDGLKKIHKLLGARITAAPKVKYVWLEGVFGGRAAQPHTSREWDIQTKRNATQIGSLPSNRRTFTRDDCLMAASSFATGNEDVAGISVTKEGPLNRYDLRAYFQDWEAVRGWTQSYLENSYYYPTGRHPPGGGFRVGGHLYMIGFYTPRGSLPFVFPGDGFRYTEQIEFAM